PAPRRARARGDPTTSRRTRHRAPPAREGLDACCPCPACPDRLSASRCPRRTADTTAVAPELDVDPSGNRSPREAAPPSYPLPPPTRRRLDLPRSPAPPADGGPESPPRRRSARLPRDHALSLRRRGRADPRATSLPAGPRRGRRTDRCTARGSATRCCT